MSKSEEKEAKEVLKHKVKQFFKDNNLEIKQLLYFLESSQNTIKEHFRQVGAYYWESGKDFYIFLDRSEGKQTPLFVAHLDTHPDPTNQSEPLEKAAFSWSEEKQSPQVITYALDDRLGLYMIYLLMRELPNTSLLLTTNEEMGRTTAEHFAKHCKEGKYGNYKPSYLVEIDRRRVSGEFKPSLVMYDYETDELNKKLKADGFEVATGSFSDICKLESLDVAGFNFTATYNSEHSASCNAYLCDFVLMFGKLKDWILANPNPIPHDKDAAKKYSMSKYSYRGARGYSQWDYYGDEYYYPIGYSSAYNTSKRPPRRNTDDGNTNKQFISVLEVDPRVCNGVDNDLFATQHHTLVKNKDCIHVYCDMCNGLNPLSRMYILDSFSVCTHCAAQVDTLENLLEA